MYRIARIRLAGIGPADARFDKPSPDAVPFEISCLGAEGVPEDSVVWLENGGGKTVFLSLLFHVLRPDRAAQIGNDDQGGRRADIGDFILADAVGHVVCEWVAADSDERILTGLVAERRGANVNRTWYLVSIRDGAMTLDDLVFDVDGRRVPAARYIESLEQTAAKAGKAGRRNRVEVTKTSVQRRWFEVLSDHDLDPALFEYQVRMNRSEGGATSLFRFSSAEKFVEFFLDLTMNPDTVAAVSDELVRVAEKVATLPRKELELAHATGAVERLTVLHDRWTAYEAATAAAGAARRDAEVLHDRLVAAVTSAAGELAAAEADLAEADEERSRADRTRREADTRSKMAAIALAEARVTALADDVSAADGAAADAALTASAWPRLAQHQRLASLNAQIGELRRAVEAADRGAAPLRARRDELLRALRREYATAADLATRNKSDADTDRTQASAEEQEAEGQLRAAEGRIQEIAGLLSGFARDVEIHTRAFDRAVANGTIARNDDVAAVLATVRTDIAELGDLVSATAEERKTLAGELRSLRDHARTAGQAAVTAQREHADHQRLVDDATEQRRRLAADSLLASLGAEDADLELVGADLVGRVTSEADRLRGDAIAEAAAAAEDRRAADHLERDRLLPARAEVDALCQQLTGNGVASAVPGWRYLVEVVPAANHEAVIASHPAVLDGIVVAANDFERAREVLGSAAPSAAVLVVTGSTLTDPTGDPLGWVVPPAAAMHDRAVAEAELDRRHERLAQSDARTGALQSAEGAARAYANALQEHLNTWPAGSLPAAVELAIQLAGRAETAAAKAKAAAEAVTAAEDLIAETDRTLEQLRQRLAAGERRVGGLERLDDTARRAASAEAEADQLRTERDALSGAAEAARAAIAAARERIEAARRRHSTAERAADAATSSLSTLPDPGDGPADDETDIAALRAALERAERLVAEATTDSELARQLAGLDAERAKAEEEWTALDAALRERVTSLAATPAAGDPAARRKAEADATASHAAAAKELASVRARLDVAKAARANLAAPEPSWPVEPFDMPSDLAELEIFAADMDARFEEARQAAAAIREVLASRTVRRDGVQQRHEALTVQAEALVSSLGERTVRDAAPFEGSARDAVRAALRRTTDAAEERDRCDADWRGAAHAVGVFARDDRWKVLEGEMSRRLRDDQPDDLARSSGELLTQTRILESRLRDDINRLDTHRQVLITSLGDAVNEAARGLRSARKKSELPSGLGDWTGQPFLKIGLDLTADRAERDGRLRRFTNDLLERAAAAKGSLPTGADLICQAVLACAERAVTVEVLKPNKAQRLRYVPITETATLSGGMRATAAIAMFCTLAKVRAANRTGRIGVGTLVLDNPLGDANATYLVALQRLVARMNDVQLIYTTGVNDMDALRLFPVITRLTNEVGKRSHLAYVIADEAILKRLAPSDGDNAVITGTRLVRRTPPILTTDLAAMAGDDD